MNIINAYGAAQSDRRCSVSVGNFCSPLPSGACLYCGQYEPLPPVTNKPLPPPPASPHPYGVLAHAGRPPALPQRPGAQPSPGQPSRQMSKAYRFALEAIANQPPPRRPTPAPSGEHVPPSPVRPSHQPHVQQNLHPAGHPQHPAGYPQHPAGHHQPGPSHGYASAPQLYPTQGGHPPHGYLQGHGAVGIGYSPAVGIPAAYPPGIAGPSYQPENGAPMFPAANGTSFPPPPNVQNPAPYGQQLPYRAPLQPAHPAHDPSAYAQQMHHLQQAQVGQNGQYGMSSHVSPEEAFAQAQQAYAQAHAQQIAYAQSQQQLHQPHPEPQHPQPLQPPPVLHQPQPVPHQLAYPPLPAQPAQPAEPNPPIPYSVLRQLQEAQLAAYQQTHTPSDTQPSPLQQQQQQQPQYRQPSPPQPPLEQLQQYNEQPRPLHGQDTRSHQPHDNAQQNGQPSPQQHWQHAYKYGPPEPQPYHLEGR